MWGFQRVGEGRRGVGRSGVGEGRKVLVHCMPSTDP